jgi:hypothetical protein
MSCLTIIIPQSDVRRFLVGPGYGCLDAVNWNCLDLRTESIALVSGRASDWTNAEDLRGFWAIKTASFEKIVGKSSSKQDELLGSTGITFHFCLFEFYRSLAS